MKRLVLAAGIVAAAIASGSASAAPGPAPHVYTVTIKGTKIAPLNATWRLTLQPKAFSLTRAGAVAVIGSLTIAGSTLTFHDLAGQFACRGKQASGKYRWRLVGAKLRLTRVADACVGRRTVLAYTFRRIA